jgi:hypothetical protein
MSQNLTVMPKPSHAQTVEEALKEALAKAPEMKRVLIIWDNEDETPIKAGSMDNDLTITEAVYLARLFEHGIFKSVLQKGDQ